MKRFLNGFSVIFALILSYHFIINLIASKPINIKEIILVSFILNFLLTILHFSILIGKGHKIGDKPEKIVRKKDFEELIKKMNQKKWKKVEDSETKIRFNIKMNSLYSFGEKITFEKVSDEHFRVYSKSTFPLTIFDYGKNLDNIKNLS